MDFCTLNAYVYYQKSFVFALGCLSYFGEGFFCHRKNLAVLEYGKKIPGMSRGAAKGEVLNYSRLKKEIL